MGKIKLLALGALVGAVVGGMTSFALLDARGTNSKHPEKRLLPGPDGWDEGWATQVLRYDVRKTMPELFDEIVIETLDDGDVLDETKHLLAIVNSMHPLVGGPKYHGVYLVGPMLIPTGGYVTSNWDEAFRWGLLREAPVDAAHAERIAHLYASLRSGHGPSGLKIIEQGQIEAGGEVTNDLPTPQVIVHPAGQKHGVGTFYEVVFVAKHPDSWGDTVEWRITVGQRHISAMYRPIVRLPRVLE